MGSTDILTVSKSGENGRHLCDLQIVPRLRSGHEYFNPQHIDVKPFRTAFVRPDQFRFGTDDLTPDKAYIVGMKAARFALGAH